MQSLKVIVSASFLVMGAVALSSLEKGPSTPGVYPWAYCDASVDTYGRPCENTWASKYSGCQGTMQSPINFVSTSSATNNQGQLIMSSSACSSFTALDGPSGGNGWTVDLNSECKATTASVPEGSSYVTFQGIDYYLIQFHFHAPSEHTLEGVTYDMDAHFVHSSLDGQLLVLGGFVNATATEDNAFLAKFWSTGFVGNTAVSETTRPYWFFPQDDRSLYHYIGSLTTPPCTEGVKWFHFSKPLTMSPAQLTAFKTALGGLNQTAAVSRNNRLPQPLNGRTVFKFAHNDVTYVMGRNPSSSPSPSPMPSPSNSSGHGSPGIAAFTPIGIIILLMIILWERWCDRRSSGGEERWKSGSTVAPEGPRDTPLQVTATPV